MFNNYCVASVDPIPCGGEIYAPPTTFRQFSPDVIIRGGSNYTLNLSFVITEHLKLVSGKKIFLHRVGGRQIRNKLHQSPRLTTLPFFSFIDLSHYSTKFLYKGIEAVTKTIST